MRQPHTHPEHEAENALTALSPEATRKKRLGLLVASRLIGDPGGIVDGDVIANESYLSNTTPTYYDTDEHLNVMGAIVFRRTSKP